MPIKQDFSTFRRPIDPYETPINILGSLSKQVGQYQERENQLARDAAAQEIANKKLALAQAASDLDRDKYGLLKAEADRKNAERAAMDKFNKIVSGGTQDVDGWLTDVAGSSTKNKKLLESITFTPEESAMYEQVGGDVSKLTGTAKDKAVKQLELGSLAGSPLMQETQTQLLTRAMGQASEEGIVPDAMRKELQTAQAAEAAVTAAKRASLEKIMSESAKESRESKAKAAKARSDAHTWKPSSTGGGKSGSSNGYNSKAAVMKKINAELSNTDWGSGALGGKDLKEVANDYMVNKKVPPAVMAYAIEYLKEGQNDALLDKDVEVNKKALEATITDIMKDPKEVKKITNGYSRSGRYDTTYENTMMQQAREADVAAKTAQAKLGILGDTPEERQVAQAEKLFGGLFKSTGSKPTVTTGGQKKGGTKKTDKPSEGKKDQSAINTPTTSTPKNSNKNKYLEQELEKARQNAKAKEAAKREAGTMTPLENTMSKLRGIFGIDTAEEDRVQSGILSRQHAKELRKERIEKMDEDKAIREKEKALKDPIQRAELERKMEKYIFENSEKLKRNRNFVDSLGRPTRNIEKYMDDPDFLAYILE